MSKQSNFSKSNAKLKKLPTKKKTMNDKKTLMSYLSGEYGITYFNKMFACKLEHIHEGTLQNLQMPITYDVLLDMFKYYKQDLDKQRIHNKKIGKIFDSQQGTLSYDLAIILAKHSDYLLDLEKEKARAAEVVKLQYIPQITKPSIHKENKDDGVDINKMLEDWM